MHIQKREFDPERQPAHRRWVVQGYMIFRPNARFNPPTDVIEYTDRLVVVMEIAGMRPSDFNVTLTSNHLIVTGVRERPPLEEGAYHQVEIGYGEFRVEVLLPWTVEPDQVSATYRDGFLEIGLPRRPEKVLRIVDVESMQEETE